MKLVADKSAAVKGLILAEGVYWGEDTAVRLAAPVVLTTAVAIEDLPAVAGMLNVLVVPAALQVPVGVPMLVEAASVTF